MAAGPPTAPIAAGERRRRCDDPPDMACTPAISLEMRMVAAAGLAGARRLDRDIERRRIEKK